MDDNDPDGVAAYVEAQDASHLHAAIRRWQQHSPEGQVRVVLALSARLPSGRFVDLKAPNDTHVWSRLAAGKMEFQGHGLMLQQDVFLENGRCAWAIEELLGCTLPTFTESMGGQETCSAALEAERRIALRLNELFGR